MIAQTDGRPAAATHAAETQPGVTLQPPARGLCFGRRRDWLVGGALLFALVLIVHIAVGWGPLLAPWSELPWSVLSSVFGLAAMSLLLRAWRFYDYFRPALKGCFPTVLRLTVLHNTANNLLPMRSGELVFPWLMQRYFGHGLLKAAAGLVWIRLLDLHTLGLCGIGILYLREPSPVWPFVGALWLAGLVPLSRVGRLGRTTVEACSGGWLRRFLIGVAAAAPTGHTLVARLYLWTALIWLLKITAFAIVLRHFVSVDFWRVLVGVLTAELSSILPVHGIAGSGTYELAAVAALVPLGVEPTVALTGAVNLHLFLLGVTLVLAALAPFLPIRRPRLDSLA